jgi:pimeloyl-ACP methyl ester carboxylesterase
MSAILLDGGIVHYEVIGRGRPIIFLHGWVGSWRYWIPALQTASTNFRAYAVDLWGFGDTGRESNRYTIQQQIILVERFLGEMGIGKVALVGHGLGALVCMLYALRSPENVDRVMAVSCPLGINAVNNRLRTGPLPDLVDWLLDKNPAAEPARADAVKADPRALATSFSDMATYNISINFSNFRTPCLMVHGQNDPAVANPSLDLVLTRDSVHQITLEQSGHFPMLDETLTFNRLLIDWLALDSGQSPRDLQLKEEWKRRVR